MLEKVIAFRQHIHQYPEISGEETQTRKALKDFLTAMGFSNFKELNGGSFLVYLGDSSKAKIVFRAEQDALPIQEENEMTYQSSIQGKAHLCGHDGHMSTLLYLAELIKNDGLSKYCPCLLFQSAEETGQGAKLSLADEQLKKEHIKAFFAYHNLPAYPKGKLLFAAPTFAAGSVGVKIRLRGHTAHAARPEQAKNPSKAMRVLMDFCDANTNVNGGPWMTVCHARLGEAAFGITPGEALLQVTVRSFDQQELEQLLEQLKQEAIAQAEKENLKIEVEFLEDFPVLMNHPELHDKVLSIAQAKQYERLEEPVCWSEDFAFYREIAPIYMFCVGSGEQQPPLHNPGYDFPDEIIEPTAQFFHSIAKKLDQHEL